MKGGGLKDSREGTLCDSGSLAGDLAEECSTAEKNIMIHDHERKSRQQAHGRRFTPTTRGGVRAAHRDDFGTLTKWPADFRSIWMNTRMNTFIIMALIGTRTCCLLA